MTISGIKAILWIGLTITAIGVFYFVHFLPTDYPSCEAVSSNIKKLSNGSTECDYLGVKYDYVNYLSMKKSIEN